jgi:MoxR-like ATPase
MTPGQLLEGQAAAGAVHVAPSLLDYLQEMLSFSRRSSLFRTGLSPRAGLGLLRAARAWALLHRRDFVVPEDIQAVLRVVMGHRLRSGEEQLGHSSLELTERLIAAVGVPA